MSGEREPFSDSICHDCAHVARVETRRGSAFLRCREPSLPKYGPQPVLTCRRFRPAEAGR